MSDINKVISKYYYDPRKGLTSVDKLYRKLKKDDIDVSRKQIKEFIDKQSTAQIHKEERVKVNSFIPRHKDHEVQIDLIYLEDSRLNKNKKYALTAINTFTKQLAIETLTKRDNTNVINAMHKVLTKLDIKPQMIYSDLGSEFTSKPFKELMKSLDIEHVTTNTHANMIERVHRTIKEMIAKYKTSTKSRTWENILDDIVENYNTSYHSTIGFEPNDINDENKHIAQMNIIKHAKPIVFKEVLNIGDQVRKKIIKKDLGGLKGYKPKWSEEIYNIIGKVKSRYTINDNGEPIIRSQLQKIKEVQFNPNPKDLKNTKEGSLIKKGLPLSKHLSAKEDKEIRELNEQPIIKSKKEIEKILQKEGISKEHILDNSKSELKVGSIISIRIKNDNGVKKWFRGEIIKKKRGVNKFEVKYANGDDNEILNFNEEEYKIIK